MAINVESLKELTEKLLELRRNSRKVEGYKVNTLKSVTFLYNNCKQWDFKFKIKLKKTNKQQKKRVLEWGAIAFSKL